MMTNISEINKVNGSSFAHMHTHAHAHKQGVSPKDPSQRRMNPEVVKTEVKTMSQTASPTSVIHPETTQLLDPSPRVGPVDAMDPLVSSHLDEDLSDEKNLSLRTDNELMMRIHSLNDEDETEGKADRSRNDPKGREGEGNVVENNDQKGGDLTDDDRHSVSAWGVNPLVQVNNKLTLRTRNVLSPYIEDHALLNRREKELMKGGKANTAENIMNDMMTHLQLLMESAEIVLDEDDSQEIGHIQYVHDPMGDLVRYTRNEAYAFSHEATHVAEEEARHAQSVGNMVVEARVGMGPVVETTTVKRGGASYQVPTPIHQGRRESRAVRWLVEGAKLRLKKDHLHGMAESLALEVLHVLNDRDVLKKQDADQTESTDVKDSNVALASYGVTKMVTLHKNAKANRVFAHRRWH